jgi:outer membrane immunogenic protein
MKKIIMALAATAAVTTAAPALAQDRAPVDPRIDGFRVEAQGGWDRVTEGGGGQSGFTYGLGLGYDFAVSDNFFIGVEGNINDNTTKECVAGICANAGLDLSAGVRAGFASLGGKLYVLGGYTHAKAGVSVGGVGVSAWGDGWRVGSGYQYTFNNGVYIKAEYRYSDYQGGLARHNVIGGIGYQF